MAIYIVSNPVYGMHIWGKKFGLNIWAQVAVKVFFLFFSIFWNNLVGKGSQYILLPCVNPKSFGQMNAVLNKFCKAPGSKF
jgi:hypothetical protein